MAREFKIHMAQYATSEGDFCTFCGISDYTCSEAFFDNAKIVDYGDPAATCKRCISEYKKEEKRFNEYLDEERERLNTLPLGQ